MMITYIIIAAVAFVILCVVNHNRQKGKKEFSNVKKRLCDIESAFKFKETQLVSFDIELFIDDKTGETKTEHLDGVIVDMLGKYNFDYESRINEYSILSTNPLNKEKEVFRYIRERDIKPK